MQEGPVGVAGSEELVLHPPEAAANPKRANSMRTANKEMDACSVEHLARTSPYAQRSVAGQAHRARMSHGTEGLPHIPISFSTDSMDHDAPGRLQVMYTDEWKIPV